MKHLMGDQPIDRKRRRWRMRPILEADDTLREEEHAEDHAHGEHDGDDDRQLVEVLLHDAGGSAGIVQRTSDHVGNAGALTGVHQHERDKEKTGERPNGEQGNLKWTHE